MIFFVFTGEKWLSNVKLIEDAAEGPHVDRTRVTDTQYDFGRAIEPRLDVGVYFLVFEAPGAKVDYFDSGLVNLSKKNILRFQVAVHDVVFTHVVKGDEDLDGEPLDQAQAEPLKVVHLDEVVQVDAE